MALVGARTDIPLWVVQGMEKTLLPLLRCQATKSAVPEMVAKKTGLHEPPVNKP
jgi:hypothetical protein